ncbi:MAG: aminoglycoside phosphotransferase family protein [Anaerolineales bacterium]
MNLPPDFIQTIQNTFQRNGKAWLSELPDLIAEASRRWDLTDIQPVPNLSYNFVAYAKHNSGNVILKIGVQNNELTSGIAALQLYNGRGACRLLDADTEKGMLLLERLVPGRMLAAVMDDKQATRIAAHVMTKLWQPAPENRENFIQLADWFDGFKRLRKRFDGSTGPFPEDLVARAEKLSGALLSENKDETLLHGDFHHFNVLEAERGWLAIDPKGVIGPRGYEVGPLLMNPVPKFLNGSRPKAQTEMRIAVLSEVLGMERERIRAWALCHAILSAWWSLEEGQNWAYAVHCGEIFAALG